MTPVESATVTLVPDVDVLDDLELLRNGALAEELIGPDRLVSVPLDGVEVPDGVRTVRVEDPEGVPLALIPVTGSEEGVPSLQGRPEWLARRSARPYENLHLPPVSVPRVVRVVVVDHGFEGEVPDDDGSGSSLILALASTDGEGAHTEYGTVRAAQAWASTRGNAQVVVVPLGSAAARRREKIDRVIAAYAGDAAVVDLTSDAAAVAGGAGGDDSGGLVVFFTGLSGSGKSTIARQVRNWLIEHSRAVTFLDGDLVRRHLSAGLGFSAADRDRNIRRIGWVAAEVAAHGGIAICSPIAPFERTRAQVRDLVRSRGGRFVLVHVATPLAECERRDRKGLYARARRGEIPEFTGISSPYEAPEDPDLRVDTTGTDVRVITDQVLTTLGFAHVNQGAEHE